MGAAASGAHRPVLGRAGSIRGSELTRASQLRWALETSLCDQLEVHRNEDETKSFRVHLSEVSLFWSVFLESRLWAPVTVPDGARTGLNFKYSPCTVTAPPRQQ